MAELRAGDWTNSTEKLRRERRIIRPAYPLIFLSAKAAMLGVKLVEPGNPAVTHHDRSLLPGQTYRAPKIGARSSSGSEPGHKLSEVYSRLMIDELLHFKLVVDGTASIVGPRGVTPEHRERLFDSVSGGEVDEWTTILSQQRHGIIDSYSLQVHSRPGSGVSLDDEASLTDAEVAREASARLECNRRDFYNASRSYDNDLLRQFVHMVLSRATGGRIGHIHGAAQNE